MKQDDIANAKDWSSRTPADGEGWRPVIGRLANRVEELERENANLRVALGNLLSVYDGTDRQDRKGQYAREARDLLANAQGD